MVARTGNAVLAGSYCIFIARVPQMWRRHTSLGVPMQNLALVVLQISMLTFAYFCSKQHAIHITHAIHNTTNMCRQLKQFKYQWTTSKLIIVLC